MVARAKNGMVPAAPAELLAAHVSRLGRTVETSDDQLKLACRCSWPHRPLFFFVSVRIGRVFTDRMMDVADGHVDSVDVCVRCDPGRVEKQSVVPLVAPIPVKRHNTCT